jgi:hypothetical protein
MTSEERAAAEELLTEVVAALKLLQDSKEDSADETRQHLEQMSIDLRRQLYIDATDRSRPEQKQTVGPAVGESPLSKPNAAVHQGGPSTDRVARLEQWLREDHSSDFVVSPLVRIIVLAACLLAWIIQPEATDHSLALSLLMFLRFVPIFIVGGFLCGRVARGAVIGTGLFFILMMTDSLSLLTWDFQHIIREDLKTVRHASNLATILFLVGGVGLALTVTATFARRQNRSHAYERYLSLSLQALVAVQLAFVIELGHTSLRHFTDADRYHAGLAKTLRIIPHRTYRSR